MATKYRLYDLIVESEIPLVETAPLESSLPADVSIRFGTVSLAAEDHPSTIHYTSDGQWWRCVLSRTQLFFNTRIALYEVVNGNEIIIQTLGDPGNDLIRTYSLGTAMGVLQVQRGSMPIHGGSIAHHGKAVIISGMSGAGKSTLTSALVGKGFSFLADDVSTITTQSGIPEVIPAYPQRKLIRNACIQLGFDPDQLVSIDGQRDKFSIRDNQHWHDSRLPLGWMFEIVLGAPDEPLQILPIDGLNKLNLLRRNFYRSWIQEDLGIPPEQMKQVLTTAAHMKAFCIRRPQGRESLEEITNQVMALLRNDEN